MNVPALPKGLAEGSPLYRNTYECPCGTSWEDTWDSGCDDDCPSCGLIISPTDSECLSEGKQRELMAFSSHSEGELTDCMCAACLGR